MDSKSMGSKIRLCRAKQGLSIQTCAERIGISTRYLADIERGDKVPKLETLLQILNTLHASADEVLQDSLQIGYEAKSNNLLGRLQALDTQQRAQALAILDHVITVLQKP